MNVVSTLAGIGLFSLALATSASAAIVLDGLYDSDYGAAKSSVAYDPAAPVGNFGTPTNKSNTTSYLIYLTDQGSNYYGFLKSATATGLPFANLYFDLDPQNNNGSDLGFEVTNSRAFIPGTAGYAAVPGLQFVVSVDGTGIEFLIPNSAFTMPIAGLSYSAGQAFPGNGDSVTLRLSQSFGYSVAGGASYGANRLGSVALAGSVPEPSTWAILMLGLAGLSFASRRGKRNRG